MKILKYLFLLLILALIGLTVFIATQNGSYSIKRSVFIKVQKEIVFNYINDYRNWDQWLDLRAEPAEIRFNFPENTIGQGGSFSWNSGNETGIIQSVFVKENDSIAQKININDVRSTSALTLKDSIGGTKLSWSIQGSADFLSKLTAFFTGGIEQSKATFFQNSLNNVDAIITRELKNFSIQVIGEVKIDSIYYVKQTATAKIRDLNSKITPMLQRMEQFFKNGNITMNGKPFVQYESNDVANGTITFSVCGPLREQIFVSNPSDVSIEKRLPFTALKTVLKGDYSHRPAAIKKALAYISEKKYVENTALKQIDVYTINASDEKSPSKWVTEILIPIQPKVVEAPVYITPPTITETDLIVE